MLIGPCHTGSSVRSGNANSGLDFNAARGEREQGRFLWARPISGLQGFELPAFRPIDAPGPVGPLGPLGPGEGARACAPLQPWPAHAEARCQAVRCSRSRAANQALAGLATWKRSTSKNTSVLARAAGCCRSATDIPVIDFQVRFSLADGNRSPPASRTISYTAEHRHLSSPRLPLISLVTNVSADGEEPQCPSTLPPSLRPASARYRCHSARAADHFPAPTHSRYQRPGDGTHDGSGSSPIPSVTCPRPKLQLSRRPPASARSLHSQPTLPPTLPALPILAVLLAISAQFASFPGRLRDRFPFPQTRTLSPWQNNLPARLLSISHRLLPTVATLCRLCSPRPLSSSQPRARFRRRAPLRCSSRPERLP